MGRLDTYIGNYGVVRLLGAGGPVCRPYKRGGGNLPPHPPQCVHWGTFPQEGRLKNDKKRQVWDLSLKTQRRNAVSQKISLPTFFFKESRLLQDGAAVGGGYHFGVAGQVAGLDPGFRADPLGPAGG